MFAVDTIYGDTAEVGRRLLWQLWVMTGRQVRECGYEPDSVAEVAGRAFRPAAWAVSEDEFADLCGDQ